MTYQVRILPAALRQLQRLPKPIRARIQKKIDALADNPRPQQSKLLKGKSDYSRLRIGDYRVIYRIENDQLIIFVVKIGHRKEIYRSSK